MKSFKETIGKRIKEIRKKLGYTQEEFAHLVDCNERTYAGYERGERNQPIDLLITVANLGNTTLEYITGHANDPRSPISEFHSKEPEIDRDAPLTEKSESDSPQYEVIARAKELPEDDTEEVAGLLNELVATKSPRSQVVSDINRLKSNDTIQGGRSLKWIGNPHAVPVYDRVPCGAPGEVAGQIGIAMAYDSKTDYLLEVSDDSMSTEINKGDLVEVQVTGDTEPSQAVVALTDAGETTLKYLVADPQKGLVLRSLDPAYKDIPVRDKSCIQGVVIGVKKPKPRYKQATVHDHLAGRTDVPDLQEDTMEAYEASGDLLRRMIGPELAYCSGLEAAANAAGFKFDMKVLEIDNATPPGDVAAILDLVPGEQALKP